MESYYELCSNMEMLKLREFVKKINDFKKEYDLKNMNYIQTYKLMIKAQEIEISLPKGW